MKQLICISSEDKSQVLAIKALYNTLLQEQAESVEVMCCDVADIDEMDLTSKMVLVIDSAFTSDHLEKLSKKGANLVPFTKHDYHEVLLHIQKLQTN